MKHLSPSLWAIITYYLCPIVIYVPRPTHHGLYYGIPKKYIHVKLFHIIKGTQAAWRIKREVDSPTPGYLQTFTILKCAVCRVCAIIANGSVTIERKSLFN